MTDKELIELAARAMGYEIVHSLQTRCIVVNPKTGWRGTFAPLHSNSDCARMEAELEIDVEWFGESVVCSANHSKHLEDEPYGTDKAAARRRASTRVAAEIGRKMKAKEVER